MTATTVPARSAYPQAQRVRSTTRRTLLRLLTALLALTAAVFASTLLTFTRVHRTAETVRTRTAPAIVDLAAARLALVQADAAVIDSFQTPEGQLTGPGEEFQNQMAIAGQNLTQAAADSKAGSRRLQLVEELLVTYQGLVGQAVVHFWQPNGKALGVTDLFSASRLLHGSVVTQEDETLAQRGGIVGELDELTRDQQRTLDDQLAAGSRTPVAILAVLVPLLGLLGLLLAAQLAFRRRFRRRINPWLLLATGLLLTMASISIRSAAAQHHLEDARATLHQLVADRQRQGSAAEVRGQQALRELLNGIQCPESGRCGYTAELFNRYVAGPMPPASSVANSRLTAETERVDAHTAAATAGAYLGPAIYVLAVLSAAAVFLGFRPRLAEYRYRPR